MINDPAKNTMSSDGTYQSNQTNSAMGINGPSDTSTQDAFMQAALGTNPFSGMVNWEDIANSTDQGEPSWEGGSGSGGSSGGGIPPIASHSISQFTEAPVATGGNLANGATDSVLAGLNPSQSAWGGLVKQMLSPKSAASVGKSLVSGNQSQNSQQPVIIQQPAQTSTSNSNPITSALISALLQRVMNQNFMNTGIPQAGTL